MHSDVKKYIDEDGRVINADTGEIIKDVDPNAQDSDAIYVCKKSGIEYNPVMELDDKLSEDDIIARLGGGDKTKGSCSSLAFAYTGNMNGLDVLDFRGGESTYAFSTNMLIKDIANMSGVNSTILRGKREIKMVNDIAGTMQIGSHYYLAAGRHAAIVRRNEAGFQYLELQSATRNGFKPLTSGVLRDRFACTQRSTRDRSVILIDCDSLGSSDDFRRILGYINTDPSRQMKGSTGHER